ncbi:rhodanese-like domain-containing protein [Allobacillus sp. GCM10007491]|uniref:Rhodanese-like domain-containing protein n=3 Tax=Allobacillus TaxID=1400133 RepID=A0A941CVZ2_9BACI|nr:MULTISPECIES: rhodanese-like domain-containing protein [Allobacillus]MBR7555002.1 rhodanese-like domain-containing protein [Allobacillus saliphilus]MBU6080300.1 rhodanese-like domain-containing protein [Allobacillus halotolerans]TSJ61198.1 rhodanese-like domain-containing protein [Allobacillus salarius]
MEDKKIDLINKEQLKQEMNRPDLEIIDVREDDEVAEGIIPGAKHIKLGDIPTRISELSKDKEYVMVCRSGGRSNRAGVQLEEQGYNVKNLQGGMLDWDGDVSK